MTIVITYNPAGPAWGATTSTCFTCSARTLTDLMEALRGEILRAELRRKAEVGE